jgi:outer membrane receptor for monomeric catechols
MDRKNLYEFDTVALAKALMLNAGITKGLWRLATKYRFASVVGHFGQGPATDTSLSSVIAGLDRMALIPVTKPGDLVFDAETLLADSAAHPQSLPYASKATSTPSSRPKPAVKKAAVKRVLAKKKA